MKQITAFADESGTNSFDFKKEGTHFIVSAVIVDNNNLESVITQVEGIRKKHFQTGEMKSNRIGKNDPRRIRVLKDLANVDFHIYSLVVDKSKLFSDGYKYKKTFYKNLCGILYTELYKAYPDLNLIVDEHGHNPFMLSFRKYVEKKHNNTLFSEQFLFEQSHEHVMLQVADIIAGTLLRCFDQSKLSSQMDEFLAILQPKIISIKHYPNYNRIEINPEKESSDFNLNIANLSQDRVLDFIQNSKQNKFITDEHIICMRLLWFAFQTDKQKYVTTQELINHLSLGKTEKVNVHYLRTLIGQIRDAGVLIASSKGKNSGYKLPCSNNEIITYIRHGNDMILPLLSRIKTCVDAVNLNNLNTLNKSELLADPEFDVLKKIITEIPISTIKRKYM